MTYRVCPDATYVDTGQPDTYVHLAISDLALLDTAKLLNNAVREMRLVRSSGRARKAPHPQRMPTRVTDSRAVRMSPGTLQDVSAFFADISHYYGAIRH